MNPVEVDWVRTLEVALNNNFLMDSPKGKTAYAFGIVYALRRLQGKCDDSEWEQLREEAAEFSQSYMAESVRRQKATREMIAEMEASAAKSSPRRDGI
jgi:hypothetical protein